MILKSVVENIDNIDAVPHQFYNVLSLSPKTFFSNFP